MSKNNVELKSDLIKSFNDKISNCHHCGSPPVVDISSTKKRSIPTYQINIKCPSGNELCKLNKNGIMILDARNKYLWDFLDEILFIINHWNCCQKLNASAWPKKPFEHDK